MAPTLSRPLVAFDESGNTGQNLADEAQPIFVLASVCMTSAEASELLAPLKRRGGAEVKFSKVKAQDEVTSLLRSDLVGPGNIKLGVYHKPFMITTKIIDMLIEELFFRAGRNLYANRANLAMSNLWHTVIPVFCGAKAFLELQTRFLRMVRETSPDTIDQFYAHVATLRKLNRDKSFDGQLELLANTRSFASEVIDEKKRTDLDPAIPAFCDLTAQWTRQLNVPFDVVHDESKPMALEKESLELLMSTGMPARTFGGVGPEWQLPMLATGIKFVDSKTYDQVQVADILAGSAAIFCSSLARGQRDMYVERWADSNLPSIIEAGRPIWPSQEVDPAKLGQGDDGKSLEYSMRIADAERRRRERR